MRFAETTVIITGAAGGLGSAMAEAFAAEGGRVAVVDLPSSEGAQVAAKINSSGAAGGGRIVNISSITFFGGLAQMAPYVTSKGALVGLTRVLARECGEDKVTVNAVAPGAFPTAAEEIHPDRTGYNSYVLAQQAVKRRGVPADVANAVLFLSAPESSFITGQLLCVDGGWVMH